MGKDAMDIRTYRARSLQDALDLVRRDLGPDAAVLHTREVGGAAVWRWLGRAPEVEVTASAAVNVPSRLPERLRRSKPPAGLPIDPIDATSPPQTLHLHHDYRRQFRDDLKRQLDDLHSMVEDLCQRTSRPRPPAAGELPDPLLQAFTDLIDAGIDEELAQQLLQDVRRGADAKDLNDPLLIRSRISRIVESQIRVAGPVRIDSASRSVVALIGPTGVGKTTTIAKLAANFRLREKRRVGLITVDTYRIAAVEQLRTYADIMDLPMEVVSTPKQMRDASRRFAELDLVLVDTAGRSPRDEIRLQELKAMLAEARPTEVHLVLSSVVGSRNLGATIETFTPVGVTAMILTKIDESEGLGNLLAILKGKVPPISYLTDGQNVPDDIRVADARRLADLLLGQGGAGEPTGDWRAA
jgi:flagellar biosynthesis protein FlhF